VVGAVRRTAEEADEIFGESDPEVDEAR